MTKRLAHLLLIGILLGPALNAAEKIDSDMNWKIRREATDNSHVMFLMHHLTDIHGPRLTGSPGFTAACTWAMDQLKQWGMQNEHLEKWDFGHPGWGSDRYSVRVVSPFRSILNARVIAWTPGTNGTVRAPVIQMKLPEKPTQEILAAYLDRNRENVRGKFVLAGAHKVIPIAFNPPSKRRDESELRTQYDPVNPAPAGPPRAAEQAADGPKILEPREIDEKIDAFLVEAGALIKVVDAAREHGQIGISANRTYNCSRAVPGIVIRNEDYGRIARTLSDGTPVEMEIEIVNSIYDIQPSLNVVAEIPGTDRQQEVVMLGAHLDSWHIATGATDNAAGVAVMMESMRVLRKLGVKPRRTIRIALWGGEEQGLLGSQAYVKDHFGTFEAPKPEFNNLSAYINIDSGTGRIRGASVFGPPAAAAILRETLAPFEDMGIVGVNTTNDRNHRGTDSTSFSWAGLAGINLSQDPLEYFSHSWHTDLDTYERVLEDDLKQCVIAAASLAYHLATRDEMVPRFTGETMPKSGK